MGVEIIGESIGMMEILNSIINSINGSAVDIYNIRSMILQMQSDIVVLFRGLYAVILFQAVLIVLLLVAYFSIRPMFGGK